MKKKTLALIATMALVASLTACGGNTEETANTNTNEPVAESQVEQDVVEPTEAPIQESEEVVESTETVTEEAPAETEASYEVSAVMMLDGSAPESIDYEAFYNNGMFMNPEIITPYYTITNTSDSAYAISFELIGQINEDPYFEPGESIVVPAMPYMDENDNAKWCNILEAEELQYNHLDVTPEANPAQNRVQEMMTITFDESKVLYENVMSIDITLPENAVCDGGDLQYMPCYVIYYDEAGNVISSGPNTDWNIISYADKTFTYPAMYYTTTNEPFVWATADVYYSYTLAQ